MRLFLKIHLLLLLGIVSGSRLHAQLTVSGTVFDSSRRNYVPNVQVQSTGGNSTRTDTMGHYKIVVNESDSLSFIYKNRPTQKFAVKDIASPGQFDLSLGITVKDGFRTLKEVIVFAKSYRQDSMENRQTYADIYNYHKPTIRTSISPSGAVGADVDEIINMFRFRRNKRLKAFQARLEQQEQDHYVDYRFNKNFVRRITGLQGAELDTFMVRYRPDYEFASMADEVTFNKYVLTASYAYKAELLRQAPIKIPGENKN